MKTSMKRRCFCHDYYERGIYMITLETEGRRPILGRLVGEQIALSPIGEAVADCWRQIPRFHPEVQLLEFAVMPDHFHGLLFVRRRMARHLGEVVRGFKMGCTKACRAIYGATPNRLEPQVGVSSNRLEARGGATPNRPKPSIGASSNRLEPKGGEGQPAVRLTATEATTARAAQGENGTVRCAALQGGDSLFAPGYHDRILTHKGQLENLFRYIRDNPRRLAVRLAHPDYFTRINALPLAGATYAAYGNPFLLNRLDRLQLQCSRRMTPEDLATEQTRLLEAAARGAVLVSPCISPGEKQIARAAMEEGLPLIALKANCFAPKYKPPSRFFDACAAGNLLLLAPIEMTQRIAQPSAPTFQCTSRFTATPLGNTNRFNAAPRLAQITRAQCLALNRLAADICGPDAAVLNYRCGKEI